ncbi:hypothetical protein ACLOJK_004367, partial [Asimina triloba]
QLADSLDLKRRRPTTVGFSPDLQILVGRCIDLARDGEECNPMAVSSIGAEEYVDGNARRRLRPSQICDRDHKVALINNSNWPINGCWLV